MNVATIRESCAEREGSYRGGFRKIGKRYEILLTSLPEPIQAEYWLKHHKPTSTLPVPNQEPENHPFDHDVYEAIVDQYSRKAAGIKEEAQRRVYILDEYSKLMEGGFKKKKAQEIIESRHKDISRATLWRWQQRVANHPRQQGEVILAPDYQGRSRIEIDSRAWDYLYDNYGQLSEPDATVIYRETVKAAVKKWLG